MPSAFVTVDCVRGMTAKKSCKYARYGSFECLLLLLLCVLFYFVLVVKR